MSSIAGYLHNPRFLIDGPALSTESTYIVPSSVVYQTQLRCGIRVDVLQAGLFIFDFLELSTNYVSTATLHDDFYDNLKAILLQNTVLNGHLVCLYTALARAGRTHRKMVVTPRNRISVNPSRKGLMSEDPLVTKAIVELIRGKSGHELPFIDDDDVFGPIPVDVIKESLEILDDIFATHKPSYVLNHILLTATNLLLKSVRACEEHDYGSTLSVGWTLIEGLIGRLWDRFIEENRQRIIEGVSKPFINSERKDKLQGRDFTASVIIEILSLNDVISFPRYKELTTLRQARNAWLHDLKPVTLEIAQLAVRIAQDMIQQVDGFRFYLPLEISVADTPQDS